MLVRWAFRAVALVVLPAAAAAQAAEGVDVAQLVRKYRASLATKSATSPAMVILVSFAMPDSSLIRLARDAGRAGVPLVLRGLVDNSITATAPKIHASDPKGQADWQVDPRPFRALEIQGVPVFAVRTKQGWEVVRGDVSLSYALRELAQRKGPAAATAQRLAQRLQQRR